MRIAFLVILTAISTIAECANNASVTATPSTAQTLSANGSQTTYTSASNSVWTLTILAQHSGGTWTVSAYDSSHTGTETGVALNFGTIPGNSYAAAFSAGANPAIQVAGSAPGTTVVQGNNGNGNPAAVNIPFGITVSGVTAYTKPGSYTGAITFTMIDATQSPSPATAVINYSYTVTEKGQVVMGVVSLADADFTASGSPDSSPWKRTAANTKLPLSIAAVQTASSTLTLKAYVSAHTGPETAVALNIATTSQAVYGSFSQTNGATPSIQIGGSGPGTQFASATTTTTSQAAATQVLTTGLILTLPASAAPGNYTGTVTVTLAFGSTTTTTTFTYAYTIPTYLNVSLDQGLFFHITTPGTATAPSTTTGFANPYMTISATGNTAFHLNADLTALTFSSNTIPTSQLWLAINTTSTLASSDAASAVTGTPGGLASIRYPATGTLALGLYQLFLSGRIKTTTSNAPGSYTGTLTVTITAG